MTTLDKIQIATARAQVKAFGAEKMATAVILNMDKQNDKFIKHERAIGHTVTADTILAEYQKDADYMAFYAEIGLTPDVIKAVAQEAIDRMAK